MVYVETPWWAKHVLNVLYTLIYTLVIFAGVGLLITPSLYPWTTVVEGIMVGAAILAIYGVLRRRTHWEWAAVWFIIGGLSAYVAVNIVDVVYELRSGGGLLMNLMLEASVASMALLFLCARGVLLTVAVRKNRMFQTLQD